MKNGKVKFSDSLKNNSYILSLTFRTAPWYVIGRLLMGLTTGLKHGGDIYLTNLVLNAIDRGEGIYQVLYPIGLMAAFWAIYYLIFHFYWKLINAKQKLDFQHKIHKRFFEKAGELDLSCYDSPEFYNDFIYAMQNADGVMVRTADNLGDLIRSLAGSLSVFAILINVDPLVAILILSASVLNMVIRHFRSTVDYKYHKVMNEQYRKNGMWNAFSVHLILQRRSV